MDSASYPNVFISYSRADGSRVMPVAEELSSLGVPLWLDQDEISAGSTWAEGIVSAIKKSDVMLLMCSDAALHSRAVHQEVQLAWKYELTYIPVLLEKTSFPDRLNFFLEGCQWIEAHSAPPTTWIPNVLKALRHLGQHSANVESTGLALQVTRPKRGLEGLYAAARFTDRLWPLIVEDTERSRERLSYRVRESQLSNIEARHQVRLGSHLFWALDWDDEAYLLFLNEDAEGETFCLCPSRFVPEPRVLPGVSLLPPNSAHCEPFVLTGIPGRERVLALLTTEPLKLDWMPTDTEPPARVLSEHDLSSLMAEIDQLELKSWTALATHLDVVV